MRNKYIYFIAFLLFYGCAHKKDNIKSIVVKNWKGTFFFLNQLNKTNNLVSCEEKNRIDFIGNIISNFCFALSCL